MDFLTRQNKICEGDSIEKTNQISAEGKNVVVIGGGDTGSDCIGTSNRQGAKSVTQLEILEKPPVKENKLLTWPNWPLKLRTSSSHEEGVERTWSVSTELFEGENNKVKSLFTFCFSEVSSTIFFRVSSAVSRAASISRVFIFS